jgi:non-ribosomal peptide synthetase-like protein
MDSAAGAFHASSVLPGIETPPEAERPSVPCQLLHERFERQAQSTPQAIALVCGATELTYRELDNRANQLAHFLQGRGIGRGDCIGLLLPRSSELYIAILAILKSGAAYVPLEPDYPPERIQYIVSDCNARSVITSGSLAGKLGESNREVLILDKLESALSSLPVEGPNGSTPGATPSDLCYIIYTSGTTGRPKGVEIEHQSVCHLVDMEKQIFQVRRSDRVYQGFSVAFDASVEEIWLAFNSGASLVVGAEESVRAGAGLSRFLAETGVTVLSCVPTLLSILEADVPSVRLLILGGEVCPSQLIDRWWKPERRIVNTYGPTEATVIATFAECVPGKSVTIGRPLPQYSAFVVDEELRPVPDGQPGELCLGGVGLARGYVGLPELTREKFISFAENGEPATRVYRTGDLVRWNDERELEFLGRADTQVKVRGYRVELAEIEAVLMEWPQIKSAAVQVREDSPGLQQIVAYIVCRGNEVLDNESLRGTLRSRLPAYMVPAMFQVLAELPRLASGKLDRKALPRPESIPGHDASDLIPPRTPLERQLAAVWVEFFPGLSLSVRNDFFLDLGGHSLLAARLVSRLRRSSPFEGLSIADLYSHPTIESLAAKFQHFRLAQDPCAHPNKALTGKSPAIPFWRHFLCGVAQAISLLFVLSFFAIQWLGPYLTYTVLVEEEYSFPVAVLGALSSLVLVYPCMLLVPIAVKWLVIGRYRPGEYPLWGTYYFRWWLVTTIEAAVPVGYLKGTRFYPWYLRLMGARVGPNVQLHADNFVIYDLLSIGEGTSINADARLAGYTVENGFLRLGSIQIGKRCFIGVRAAICEHTELEDDSALEDLSLLWRGGRIPAGETWGGSPAQKIVAAPCGSLNPQHRAPAGGEIPAERAHLFVGILQFIGLLVFPVLVVAALFPGIVLMNRLNYIDPYYWYLLLSPLVGMSFVGFLCLEIAAVKWLFLGRVRAGRHSLASGYYVRKWFVDRTMELSLDVLGPLYASVYLIPWYKLLGAKLGKGAEISTASFISPDLLSIGEESFIADNVSLGAPRIRGGFMTIGVNEVGKRSFVGNSALLPPATVIGSNVLIGCLSVPPREPADALREDSTWLGSPASFLPQRQRSHTFGEETTFDPSVKLRIQRAVIEFVRVITPSTCFIILTSLLFSALLLLHDHFDLFHTLLFFPWLYVACGCAAGAFAITAKWLLVGRYRPCEKPLWSTFVWRNELLNALHEHLAEPFLIGALTGTPFICWYFRLLGARIGRRVYMETTDFSEFDLATIGDEVALNADCTIQTHLFEDRVMKMSTIDIAPRCAVGAASLVLYDTRMEEGSRLGPLSLLMKGEVLPAGTSWQGIPARSAGSDRR